MRKGPIDPNAVRALNLMKEEIADEIKASGKFMGGKEDLTPGERVFFGGHVGGRMTKKMIEMGENLIINRKN